MTPPLAHVLQTLSIPAGWEWLAVAMLGLGGVSIFAGRGSAAEVAGWVVFAVAFLGLGTMVGIGLLTPTSPGYTISIAAPSGGARVTSPVQVSVCARAPNGSAVSTPDRDNVLAVLVDGNEVSAMRTATFHVLVPSGTHQLAVELLTRDHHAFSPHVAAAVDITVTGHAAPGAPAACPASPAR